MREEEIFDSLFCWMIDYNATSMGIWKVFATISGDG